MKSYMLYLFTKIKYNIYLVTIDIISIRTNFIHVWDESLYLHAPIMTLKITCCIMKSTLFPHKYKYYAIV